MDKTGNRVNPFAAIKHLDEPIPFDIRVTLSQHAIDRVKERILQNINASDNIMLEKLTQFKRGRIAEDPAAANHYLLTFPFTGDGLRLVLKRLGRDTFVAKTCKRQLDLGSHRPKSQGVNAEYLLR